MSRNLLIELVGGEPGEMLRDQFAYIKKKYPAGPPWRVHQSTRLG